MKLKSFGEHVYEKFKGNHMSVFDLDDCLVVTTAKINVYDPHNNQEYSLTPAEFNDYENKPHHKVDFTEFDDGKILLNGQPIEWVMNILKKTMNKEKAVSIITARSDKGIVIEFLKNHGIKINPDFVFAINAPGTKYKGNNAERKKQAFRELIELGYNKFRFFDDNRDNLEQAKQLENEHDDVKIEIKQVLDKWIPKFKH